MWLVCEILDWVFTGAFLIYAILVWCTPRARLHPIISLLTSWGFITYVFNSIFIRLGQTSFGGKDYSAWLPLLCPAFSAVISVAASYADWATEFTVMTLTVMTIAGWYNLEITLSTGFTIAFITIMVLMCFRVSYIMQVFVIALTAPAIILLSALGMLLQINELHRGLNLDPVCGDHVNMILVCDIRCSNVLNDPRTLVHSMFVVFLAAFVVFRFILVFRVAPDLYSEEQLQSLCWLCPCMVKHKRAIPAVGGSEWKAQSAEASEKPLLLVAGNAELPGGVAYDISTRRHNYKQTKNRDEPAGLEEFDLEDVGVDELEFERQQFEIGDYDSEDTAEAEQV